MSAILDRVQIEEAPVVEIDTEAPAAYIRVSQNPVSRTVVLRDDKILSTIDLDANGKIVGIEVVWPPEFGIQKLIAESGAKCGISLFRHPADAIRISQTSGYLKSILGLPSDR
jgi:uncharacterized protein YuzE